MEMFRVYCFCLIAVFIAVYILWAAPHVWTLWHYGRILASYERQLYDARKDSEVSRRTVGCVLAKELPAFRRCYSTAVLQFIFFRPDSENIDLRAMRRHVVHELEGLHTTWR